MTRFFDKAKKRVSTIFGPPKTIEDGSSPTQTGHLLPPNTSSSELAAKDTCSNAATSSALSTSRAISNDGHSTQASHDGLTVDSERSSYSVPSESCNVTVHGSSETDVAESFVPVGQPDSDVPSISLQDGPSSSVLSLEGKSEKECTELIVNLEQELTRLDEQRKKVRAESDKAFAQILELDRMRTSYDVQVLKREKQLEQIRNHLGGNGTGNYISTPTAPFLPTISIDTAL